MQRPHFRHPRHGPGPAGFRSPPPAYDRTGSTLPSPPWGFSPPLPPFGPRFGRGSPNTPPREFFGNRGGSGGKYFNDQSPGHTPRRSNPSPRGTPYRRSPYDNQGRHGGHSGQGSPRTSTPFGSTHGRERGTNDMEKYYKPSMLQDPWADLKPISVTETQSKCNSQHTTNTGRQGRYYN
ncbi:M-phase-specific PLK1-interacting protein [Misgurnus anguillicaudatus]|uniref:M-phase-specific PLK1-interacting protein n=1 Tax=Misgurnus anguillicaudatus TaxID=75329 RepID=UPI002435FA21|nr:M-phase-specific PLK1-interacting protein [Misgurnus anguillicaudatus]